MRERQADAAMRALEAQGLVATDVLPDTEEAMANAALRQLFVIAISPGNSRTKLQALNTLLVFTKAKPAERHAIMRADDPTEAWLQTVLLADSDASERNSSSEKCLEP
jgi:crotonobetainyl-CoA:carnitine CoA-transferase CaiB-like acyl-CoA transferase